MALKIFFGVVILSLITQKFAFGQEQEQEGQMQENEAIVNKTYVGSVSSTTPALFNYEIGFENATEQELMDTILEVEISIDTNSSWIDPLLFAIHQASQITNIKLPYAFEDKPTEDSNWYYSTKRTLCLTYFPKVLGRTRSVSVLITAYTTLPVESGAIKFNLTLTRSTGMIVGVGETRTLTVSPTATTYRRFDFDLSKIYMMEILVNSIGEGSDVCTIMASHDPYCPVLDQEENVQRTSFKKFTKTAVMRQWRDEFPKGFTMIFVPTWHDYDCTRRKDTLKIKKDKNDANYRQKTITINIREVKDVKIREMFFLPLVGLFLPCLIVALILFFCFDRRFKAQYLSTVEKNELTPEKKNSPERNPANGDTIPEVDDVEGKMVEELGIKVDGVMDEKDHVTYEKITEVYDHIVGRKARFCTVTCVVSVYYIIPAFQLLIYHVGGMAASGNYDRCYYNELCRIRTHGISDFNHVLSNGLYVLFGITFILFVGWRKRTLADMRLQNKHSEIKRGVQIPYGAYYAMGISLIMEGLLSSAYHLCPSGSTFQFDVAFMNIIAVIVISTLHQLRYRLVPSGAKTFIFLSILVMISAIFFASEAYWSNTLTLVLRIIFCTIHILSALVYCVGLYYFGSIHDQNGVRVADFRRVLKILFIPRWMPACFGYPEGLHIGNIITAKVTHRGMKLFTSILLFSANTGATVLLGLTNDFAHHLLFVLIMNTMLSFITYINWKIYHKEYSVLMIQPIVYIIMAALFGTCAIRKFKMDLTEWTATPAESRVLNQPCSEMWNGYYDHHDVWHFFSAVALFYSFMSLLTIDDGIMMMRRRDIKIF